MFCRAETSEGQAVGLVKNLALMAYITVVWGGQGWGEVVVGGRGDSREPGENGCWSLPLLPVKRLSVPPLLHALPFSAVGSSSTPMLELLKALVAPFSSLNLLGFNPPHPRVHSRLVIRPCAGVPGGVVNRATG